MGGGWIMDLRITFVLRFSLRNFFNIGINVTMYLPGQTNPNPSNNF